MPKSLLMKEMQGAITVRPERLNSKGLTIPSVGEDVQEPELSITADGSVNGYDHFGKMFGSIY